MKILLFNTLNRKKEVFKLIKDDVVTMYNCGPTVYDRAHIGNLRAYIFSDLLRRTMEYSGYKVKQVVNITDVGHLASEGDQGEDKMTKALNREKLPLTLKSMSSLAKKYEKYFVKDLGLLNIETPQTMPKASENIQEDLDIIDILEKKGYAYKTSDGIYFDTSKYSQYGKLGSFNTVTDTKSRIETNKEKKNQADFALWKFSTTKNKKNEVIGWESPWGKGFPGWHIECSAMSRKYLGQPFDIHTGGIDHIAIHHNNEIAQSEVAYDTPLANYWLHNEFVTFRDNKIAKSAGNAITLSDLKKSNISPLSYRYFILTAHYRSPITFSYEAVNAAQNALIRLLEFLSNIKDSSTNLVDPKYKEKFESSIYDDLNIPQALSLVWEIIKDNNITPQVKKSTILDFDKVLGLNLGVIPVIEDDIPPEITVLAEARDEARKNNEWNNADALRKEIETRGYLVRDTNQGFVVKPK